MTWVKVSVLHSCLHTIETTAQVVSIRLVTSEATYLVVPVVSRFLRADTVPLRLVEEMDYWLVGILDPLPFITVELPFKMDHRSEWCPASEFRWNPSIPVRNGGDGAVKLYCVHSPRKILSIRPVPKERSLFNGHLE